MHILKPASNTENVEAFQLASQYVYKSVSQLSLIMSLDTNPKLRVMFPTQMPPPPERLHCWNIDVSQSFYKR
jgi:hypothetical protein